MCSTSKTISYEQDWNLSGGDANWFTCDEELNDSPGRPVVKNN
jgi:hypothetical protein